MGKKFLTFENFFYAWQKLKNELNKNDICFDRYDYASFEVNLETNIKKLIKEIENGTYEQDEIKILPLPKKYDEEEKIKRVRQNFYVPVRTQLVWMAVVNQILVLDYDFKFWNYGNRIYYSAFYEKDNGDSSTKKLKLGWYRHTSKNLYRKWQQSWPLFKKHISITAKMLYQIKLDNDENEIIENNNFIEDKRKVRYLDKRYLIKNKDKEIKELYWLSIDFEKFYPSIKLDKLKTIFKDNVNNIVDDLTSEIIDKLFCFKIGNLKDFSIEELDALCIDNDIEFKSLPTGLFVAGFLSNLFLTNIDKEIEEEIKDENIYIFRFVDDNIILADNFEMLYKFYGKYKRIIDKYGLKINEDKIEPKQFGEYITFFDKNPKKNKDVPINIVIDLYKYMLKNNFKKSNKKELIKIFLEKERDKVKKACLVDKEFIKPFINETLKKVSNIAKTNFNLLTIEEQQNLVKDIVHLFTTDLDDKEIREDTKLSFCATKLCSFLKNKYFFSIGDYEEYLKTIQEYKKTDREILELLSQKRKKVLEVYLKYLLNAIETYHDKKNLYYKTIEFIANSGIAIEIFLERIEKIIKEKCNSLAVSSLLQILFNSLSKILIKQYLICKNNSNFYNPIQKENAKFFKDNIIENICCLEKLKELCTKKDNILNDSFKNLQMIICIVSNKDEKVNIKNLSLKEAYSLDKQFYHDTFDYIKKQLYKIYCNNKDFILSDYDILNMNFEESKIKTEDNLILDKEIIEFNETEILKKILKVTENYNQKNIEYNIFLNNEESKKIAYIGILLLILLQKNFYNAKKIWNIFVESKYYLLIFNYRYFFIDGIKNNISTDTINLLNACLISSIHRNEETTIFKNELLAQKLKFENYDDTTFDSMPITNLSMLNNIIKEIIKSISQLTIKETKRQIIKKELLNSKKISRKEYSENINISIIQSTFDYEQFYTNKDLKNPNNIFIPNIETELDNAFNRIKVDRDKIKADIILIPEISTPQSYSQKLKIYSEELESIIIAGMNYSIKDTKIRNYVSIFVPKTFANKKIDNKTKYFEIAKCNYAKEEKDTFKVCNLNFDPDDNIYLFDAGFKGKFGIIICSDIFDIERFSIYRGYIQNLLIIAYNKDTNLFTKFAETLARVLYCNVTICNTGMYSGSLVYVPYEESYKRFVYKVGGQNLFTTQTLSLPLKDIIDVQKGCKDKNEDKYNHLAKYKDRPPAYPPNKKNF